VTGALEGEPVVTGELDWENIFGSHGDGGARGDWSTGLGAWITSSGDGKHLRVTW
jgi:hypothetical protein